MFSFLKKIWKKKNLTVEHGELLYKINIRYSYCFIRRKTLRFSTGIKQQDFQHTYERGDAKKYFRSKYILKYSC